MSGLKWMAAVAVITGAACAAEISVFSADFEGSGNGAADNNNLNIGTVVGIWNVRVPCSSAVTNGVLFAGSGKYSYQLWISAPGADLSYAPSIHMEFLAATSKDVNQWNQILFKDKNGNNLLSLRFNSWSVIQRWTGTTWTKPIATSNVRGSAARPGLLNALDINFTEDGADIYYNGTFAEKTVPYLSDASGEAIRHIALTGADDKSAAWYDNIRMQETVTTSL